MKLFPTIYYAFQNPEHKDGPILDDGFAKFVTERHFKHWAKEVMRHNPHVTDCAYWLIDEPDILKFVNSPHLKLHTQKTPRK